MEPTLIITYAVLALLIARGFAPVRYRWPLMWLATLIAGSFVIADTPTIAWPIKLALWLGLVVLVSWRWRRERGALREL